MSALTTALVTYKDDPRLSEQENFNKRADLLGDVLTSAAFLGHSEEKPGGRPGQHQEAAAGPHKLGPAEKGATGKVTAPGEATAVTADGTRKVHVHEDEIVVCPIQRCAKATKVVKGKRRPRSRSRKPRNWPKPIRAKRRRKRRPRWTRPTRPVKSVPGGWNSNHPNTPTPECGN
jgi:hypothetical protein